MRYGVIDIGSNTVRLQVYEMNEDTPVTIFTKKIVAGLVTYIDDEVLTEKGCKKLIRILSEHLGSVHLFGVKETFVFATASLRNIKNLEEVKKSVKESVNFELMILSQELEAKLGYLGIQLSCDEKDGFTIDVGGGSTEIVQFKNKEASVFLNLDFGCLSIYKNFVKLLLPTTKEAKKIEKYVKKNIKIKNSFETPRVVFGIGGTIRAVGNILSEYLPENTNKYFSYEDVLLLHKKLIAQDSKLIKIILQVTPERVHTITPGTIIVENILNQFNAEGISVVNTGLREGVLIDSLKKRGKK